MPRVRLLLDLLRPVLLKAPHRLDVVLGLDDAVGDECKLVGAGKELLRDGARDGTASSPRASGLFLALGGGQLLLQLLRAAGEVSHHIDSRTASRLSSFRRVQSG